MSFVISNFLKPFNHSTNIMMGTEKKHNKIYKTMANRGDHKYAVSYHSLIAVQ